VATQAELAAELAALRRKLAKILREVGPPDQVADINFLIKVASRQTR
jgi:hypothetical protein